MRHWKEETKRRLEQAQERLAKLYPAGFALMALKRSANVHYTTARAWMRDQKAMGKVTVESDGLGYRIKVAP